MRRCIMGPRHEAEGDNSAALFLHVIPAKAGIQSSVDVTGARFYTALPRELEYRVQLLAGRVHPVIAIEKAADLFRAQGMRE